MGRISHLLLILSIVVILLVNVHNILSARTLDASVVEAKSMTVEKSVFATGKVKAQPFVVRAPREGMVKEIYVNENDSVQKDQPLVLLVEKDMQSIMESVKDKESEVKQRAYDYTQSMSQRESDFLKTVSDLDRQLIDLEKERHRLESELENARKNENRMGELYAAGAVPAKDWEESQTNVRVLSANLQGVVEQIKNLQHARKSEENNFDQFKKDSRNSFSQYEQVVSSQIALMKEKMQPVLLKSFIDGVVIKRDGEAGKYVQAGDPLLTMVNTGQTVIEALVAESEIGQIKEGQRVRVTSPAFENREFNGQVADIGHMVEENSNRPGDTGVKVKIVLDEGQELKPGMTVNVFILTGQKDITAVPLDAIVEREGEQGLMIVDQKKGAQFKPVKTGMTRDGWVEVLDLPAGTRVQLSRREH